MFPKCCKIFLVFLFQNLASIELKHLLIHYMMISHHKLSQSQEQRGAANGIAMTAMSFFKAIAPAVGGAM